MKKWQQLKQGERGAAMIVALVGLILGTLVITPVISYAATATHNVSLKNNEMHGVYAADAGMEKVLWALKTGAVVPATLTQNPNGAQVTMSTVSKGSYTLIAGEWVTVGGPHSADLHISTATVWDAGANAYKYTITCQWQGSGNCKLIGVGATIPLGYTYKPNSAASFPGNLSTANPTDTPDDRGARILSWTFNKVDIATRTQIFYIQGSDDLDDDYAWATATRDDVGTVGELTGDFYVITSTATKNSAIVGKVEANAMVSGSSVYITSYRILK